jgi:hypothetical protein
MDEWIKAAQLDLNVVRWALIGMVDGDIEPKKQDLKHLLVLVERVSGNLAEAIKETSDAVEQRPTKRDYSRMAWSWWLPGS